MKEQKFSQEMHYTNQAYWKLFYFGVSMKIIKFNLFYYLNFSFGICIKVLTNYRYALILSDSCYA